MASGGRASATRVQKLMHRNDRYLAMVETYKTKRLGNTSAPVCGKTIQTSAGCVSHSSCGLFWLVKSDHMGIFLSFHWLIFATLARISSPASCSETVVNVAMPSAHFLPVMFSNTHRFPKLSVSEKQTKTAVFWGRIQEATERGRGRGAGEVIQITPPAPLPPTREALSSPLLSSLLSSPLLSSPLLSSLFSSFLSSPLLSSPI